MSKLKERSESYMFDPTANGAIARIDGYSREEFTDNTSPATIEPITIARSDHASPEDLERFQGAVFEPERLISNKAIRRLRWQLGVREKILQQAKLEGGV